MAQIAAFRATRYRTGKVADLSKVTAPAPGLLSAEERSQFARLSEFNAVHLSPPRAPAAAASAPTAPQGRNARPSGEPKDGLSNGSGTPGIRFRHWLHEGTLAADESPALYVYRQEYRLPEGLGPAGMPVPPGQAEEGETRALVGFIAAVRLDEVQATSQTGAGPDEARPNVLAHEQVIGSEIERRLLYLKTTRADTELAWGLYDDPEGAAKAVLDKAMAQQPVADFTDARGFRQQLWRLTDPEALEALRQVLAPQSIVLAYGHHRYEAARRLWEAARTSAQGPAGSGGRAEAPASGDGTAVEDGRAYITMFLTAAEHGGVETLPVHRLLLPNSGVRRETVESRLEKFFRILEPQTPKPPEAPKRERHERGEHGERPERAERAERGERPARAERGERPARAERVARAERAEKAEQAAQAEQAEKAEGAERAERAERPDGPDRAERLARRQLHKDEGGEEAPPAASAAASAEAPAAPARELPPLEMALANIREFPEEFYGFVLYTGSGRFRVVRSKGRMFMENWTHPLGRSAWRSVDLCILHAMALERALGLKLHTTGYQQFQADPGGPGIEAVGYTTSLQEAILRVDRGEAVAAFLVKPPSLAQVMAVARERNRLPQRSVWFYPNLLSGLVFRDLDMPVRPL